jgi:hypothetical protein
VALVGFTALASLWRFRVAHEHDSDDVVDGVESAAAWGFSWIGLLVCWRCCRCHVNLLLKPK